nr:MAG TPA: RecT protein [Caudoviricetes sp.]
MNAPATSLAEIKHAANAPRETALPDITINMFSLRGFELAQRIARALSTSDAVPTAFRQVIQKKDRSGGDTEIQNPNALGNCLVAIETAQSVGMSIVAVMQHANIIEGKLSWSAQFVIAAINASRRFTPLKFRLKNLGKIKATYTETYWENREKKQKRHDIEIDNWECVAWAYEMEGGRRTDEVVESIPVSMKMAVEEGWYSKSGSKWQTEMRYQMLQYRAGAFFGRIHAPDVVMGMGKTTEERMDTVEIMDDGSVSVSTSLRDLREAPAQPAEVVQRSTERVSERTPEPTTASPATEVEKQEAQPRTTASDELPLDGGQQDGAEPPLTFNEVKTELLTAGTVEDLDYARSLIKQISDEEAKAALNSIAARRMGELTKKDEPAVAAAQPARRARAPINAD